MIYPTEAQEQEVFCKWLDLKKLDYFAVPNGGSRHKIEAVNLKKQGVKKGVSDLIVFLPDKIAFIEMKRAKKSLSSVSVDQQLFLKKLEKYHYAIGSICYGNTEAMQFINELM